MLLKINREAQKALIIEEEGAAAVLAVAQKPAMAADGDNVVIHVSFGGFRYDRTVPYNQIQIKGVAPVSALAAIGEIAELCADFNPGGSGGGDSTPSGDYPPPGGIPVNHLASAVRNSLTAADAAIQSATIDGTPVEKAGNTLNFPVIAGEKGDKGDTGERGEKGDKGDTTVQNAADLVSPQPDNALELCSQQKLFVPKSSGGSDGDAGFHLRINAEVDEDGGQGNHLKIMSDEYRFREDELYVIDISVGNQGGTSRGVVILGLGEDNEISLIHENGGYRVDYTAHIQDGEIHFYDISAGNNGMQVYSVVRIGAKGGEGGAEFYNLERFTYSAASLTYVGWRRTDGENLEEGKRYLLKGEYWNDPFEVTLDEYGWADLPNGMGVQLLERHGQIIIEGGNQSQFYGIEILSASIGSAVAPANVDVFSCIWMGERGKIERNEMLQSMGINRFELTMLECPNTLDKPLNIHLPLTRETLVGMDRLFGFTDGDTYNNIEWMLSEIADYVSWTGDFDVYGNDIASGYEHIIDYYQEIMEMMLMADSIDPKTVSGNSDYTYETENNKLMTVYPIGTMGMKGANEIVLPLIKNNDGIF